MGELTLRLINELESEMGLIFMCNNLFSCFVPIRLSIKVQYHLEFFVIFTEKPLL